MNPRSDELNGRHPHESKSIMADAFKADQLVEQVKTRAANIRKLAVNFIELNADYAKRHPWRIAITAAGIGFIAGAFFSTRKHVDKNN